MRIGIDIRKYDDYGIGTYIQNLVGAMNVQAGMEMVYFSDEMIKQRIEGLLNGEFVIDSSPKYSLRELFSISSNANKKKLDLFHAPHYTLPFRLNMPSIVTIHDIIHLRMKEYFSFAKRSYAYGMIRHACSASSAIIVDSEFGKQELLDVFPVQEKKVHVIPLGVNRSYFSVVSEEDKLKFRKKYGLTKRFVLYTGSMKPHKNVPILVSAMRRIIAHHDVQLVCTGELLSGNDFLSRYIREHNMTAAVADLGRISPEELRTAYQTASVVALPSLYEGFGFSVLEAMASGTPAIGARAASIPEVVGNAGLLFDPSDEEDLHSCIEQILTNDDLCRGLIHKGYERALQFTWEQCTDRTIHVYREALS